MNQASDDKDPVVIVSFEDVCARQGTSEEHRYFCRVQDVGFLSSAVRQISAHISAPPPPLQ